MTRDLRFAWRSIWRSKRFALMAVVAFAFGIGATTTVFSVIDAVLLRPASFTGSDSIVRVQSAVGNRDFDNVTPAVFEQLRTRSDLFTSVCGLRRVVFTVSHVPEPDQVFGHSVTGNMFSLLAAKPLKGRTLRADDDRPSAAPVALLSYKAWQKLFLSDPAVVGKSAEVDGEAYTVIGVMPQNFVVPGVNSEFWTALRLTPAEIASPNARWVEVVAKLRPGVSRARAQVALDQLSSTLRKTLAKDFHDGRLRTVVFRDQTERNYRITLWLAFGMVWGLLIIGCANLASLLLARSINRSREYAVRLATGASRGQLIRQSLIETGVLALAALSLAWVASAGALRYIREYLAQAQIGVPNLARIHLDGSVLLFGFAITVLAAVLSGLLPAVMATSIDLSTSLRESGTQVSTGNRVRRLMHMLMGVEAAMSMLLLLTSGLLVRSLVRLVTEDHGIQPDRVLTMRLPAGSWQRLSTKRSDGEQQGKIRRYVQMMNAAEGVHGVEVAALASSLPLSHVSVKTHMQPFSEVVNGDAILVDTQAVTGSYFRVMGIPLLSGRSFNIHDQSSKSQLAVVNEAFARRYFSGENLIGRNIRGDGPVIQIIGLVKDSSQLDLDAAPQPQIYLNFEQKALTPFLTGLVVRTYDDPARLARSLRAELELKHPSQAVVQVQKLRAMVDENTWRPRFSAWLFSAFALMALSLTGFGIYGIVAYATRSRKRDYGIRLALGADAVALFGLAVRES